MSFFDSKRGAGDGKANATRTNVPRAVPWVEKYRPKSLEDVTAQDQAIAVLKRTLESANLPHLLFYGSPGTGKTSTILALARQLYGPELIKSRVLELNASDERGISIVREKIKDFARMTVTAPVSGYPCPPYKLIILDEADSMTQDAQSALRRTMETYSRITRFCLICNYVTRIIDPLASRCTKFRFKPLNNDETRGRLQHIARAEGLHYDEDVMDALIEASDGDLRKAITYMQSASKLQVMTAIDDDEDVDMTSKITKRDIEEIAGKVPSDIVASLLQVCEASSKSNSKVAYNKIAAFVTELVADGWSAAQVLRQIHEAFILHGVADAKKKSHISLALSLADKRLSDGADDHLELLDLLLSIAQFMGGNFQHSL